MNSNRVEQLIQEAPNMSKLDIISALKELRSTNPVDRLADPQYRIAEDFEQMRELIQSSNWPKAVPDRYIVDLTSKGEKYERANDILRFMITGPLEGKRFLDFGCGEGHLSHAASVRAEYAVGYDITAPAIPEFSWDVEEGNVLLTTSLRRMQSEGPFDVILLYDVLDHCHDPVEVLKTIRGVAKPDSLICVRCHPWCSRHGGHLYHQMNKAFVHLVFTDTELGLLGLEMPKMKRVLVPHVIYQKWVQGANFRKAHFVTEERNPEPIFRSNRFVRARITRLFDPPGWPATQLRQNFVDFVLKF